MGRDNVSCVNIIAHSPMRVTSPLKLPMMTKKAAKMPFSRSANLFHRFVSKTYTPVEVPCTHIGTA